MVIFLLPYRRTCLCHPTCLRETCLFSYIKPLCTFTLKTFTYTNVFKNNIVSVSPSLFANSLILNVSRSAVTTYSGRITLSRWIVQIVQIVRWNRCHPLPLNNANSGNSAQVRSKIRIYTCIGVCIS